MENAIIELLYSPNYYSDIISYVMSGYVITDHVLIKMTTLTNILKLFILVNL